MRLIDKRIEFSSDLGLLLSFASTRGLKTIVDQCRRTHREALWNSLHCRSVNSDGVRCEMTERQHVDLGSVTDHDFKPIGIANSTHISGLAADVYVIVDGKISDDRKHYSPLGFFWKYLRPGNCWGGDFNGFQDLGHFSREHGGRK